MKINERLVKVSAAAIPISEELELGDDIVLIVTGSAVKSEDRDNQDGTIDRIFTVKGELAVKVEDV